MQDAPFEITQERLDSGIELASSFVSAALGRAYGMQQVRIKLLEDGQPAGGVLLGAGAGRQHVG